ncbi:hypothetical protein ABS71_17450 [bacterium SCN 62-11]|nr:hypothetical protein [Candidatus Eremiobacteraeota bacterium]ODT60198.1 MAG: hypothetical protein ABS71_17450 [bacterium SCN 62-11]
MNVGAAKLLNQYQQVRSLYAGPVEQLGVQRSQAVSRSHQTREQADTFAGECRNLELGQESTRLLARIWAGGGLQAAQKLAAEIAAETSGNVLASMALSTRHGLATGLSGKEDDSFASEGAVLLAGAMGDDPAKYADNLNAAIGREFRSSQSSWLQGEVTPDSLYALSDKMAERSRQAEQDATRLHAQAKDEWKVVEGIQGQLNQRFASRIDSKLFAEKKAAAQEFFAEFDAQDKENPGIGRELQSLAKENGEHFLSASGMLTSYRAQMTRNHGEVDKLDWRKLVGQFEHTSFR